jgi:hypothetical protein
MSRVGHIALTRYKIRNEQIIYVEKHNARAHLSVDEKRALKWIQEKRMRRYELNS